RSWRRNRQRDEACRGVSARVAGTVELEVGEAAVRRGDDGLEITRDWFRRVNPSFNRRRRHVAPRAGQLHIAARTIETGRAVATHERPTDAQRDAARVRAVTIVAGTVQRRRAIRLMQTPITGWPVGHDFIEVVVR